MFVATISISTIIRGVGYRVTISNLPMQNIYDVFWYTRYKYDKHFCLWQKKLYYQSNFPTWSTNFGQMGLKNSWNVYPLSYITGFGTKMFCLGCLFYIYSQQWVTHYFTLNMYWNILNFRVTMGYFSRINIPKTMFKLTEVILLIMYSNLNHLAWFGIKFV